MAAVPSSMMVANAAAPPPTPAATAWGVGNRARAGDERGLVAAGWRLLRVGLLGGGWFATPPPRRRRTETAGDDRRRRVLLEAADSEVRDKRRQAASTKRASWTRGVYRGGEVVAENGIGGEGGTWQVGFMAPVAVVRGGWVEKKEPAEIHHATTRRARTKASRRRQAGRQGPGRLGARAARVLRLRASPRHVVSLGLCSFLLVLTGGACRGGYLVGRFQNCRLLTADDERLANAMQGRWLFGCPQFQAAAHTKLLHLVFFGSQALTHRCALKQQANGKTFGATPM
jgi:hypothetical protein